MDVASPGETLRANIVTPSVIERSFLTSLKSFETWSRRHAISARARKPCALRDFMRVGATASPKDQRHKPKAS